ncbi:hypothetical protein RDp07_gp59 [Roseobacter phage RD-1410Ws-07]|uniref:Uncharacterized protein n=2 Tax=Sanyabayvirus DS1410Ws06 TaxID=2844087 RepID=A0A191VYT2_9CAUD|nr:hypothetical protein HYO98_gp62 [Dinoroseobacter phage DS-1410Ws-06]ANJ20719.1 hypothetical protein DSp06_gp62 [Dinoroseobacter phage DS-1410Ws-06]ANJ20870.1 hypothetical protein RDp07_gp59 [Roseobacter phage RD-1410Ws-07]
MDDISNKTNAELLELVTDTEDKEVLRFIANELDITFSGNTGNGTLKEKIIPVLQAKIEAETETPPDANDPVAAALAAKQAEPAPAPEPKSLLDQPRTLLAKMDPRKPGLSEVEKRAIVRAKALRLHRVRVHNLDPSEAAVPGAIKTVFNKYLGKVSKYVPYGDENEHGWHLPECLINSMKQEKYTMRKEIKTPGSSFGVKQYKTVQMPRFNIEYLDELTEQELEALGQDQKARGAIDTAAA